MQNSPNSEPTQSVESKEHSTQLQDDEEIHRRRGGQRRPDNVPIPPFPETKRCTVYFRKHPQTLIGKGNFELTVNDDWGILQNRLRQVYDSLPEKSKSKGIWNHESSEVDGGMQVVFLRKTISTSWKNVTPVNRENFASCLEDSWKLSNRNRVIDQGWRFTLVVKTKDPPKDGTVVHRASQARIEQATERIREHQSSRGEAPLGRFQERQFATAVARAPDDLLIDVEALRPANSTFSQAGNLDRIASLSPLQNFCKRAVTGESKH